MGEIPILPVRYGKSNFHISPEIRKLRGETWKLLCETWKLLCEIWKFSSNPERQNCDFPRGTAVGCFHFCQFAFCGHQNTCGSQLIHITATRQQKGCALHNYNSANRNSQHPPLVLSLQFIHRPLAAVHTKPHVFVCCLYVTYR